MKPATPLALFALALAANLIPAPASADQVPTYVLVIKDGTLLPSTLDVPANTRFRLEVRNEGKAAAEFESIELKKELVLAPGVTRKLMFNPLKPGSYPFVDEFHADTAQGRIVAR